MFPQSNKICVQYLNLFHCFQFRDSRSDFSLFRNWHEKQHVVLDVINLFFDTSLFLKNNRIVDNSSNSGKLATTCSSCNLIVLLNMSVNGI